MSRRGRWRCFTFCWRTEWNCRRQFSFNFHNYISFSLKIAISPSWWSNGEKLECNFCHIFVLWICVSFLQRLHKFQFYYFVSLFAKWFNRFCFKSSRLISIRKKTALLITFVWKCSRDNRDFFRCFLHNARDSRK